MKYVTLAAVVLTVSAAHADPLANARTGQLQCYRPDMARKTCSALSGYSFTADGKISNKADVLLGAQPVLVMRTVSPVVVKGEAVCGTARKEDIDAATILVNGTALPDEKAVEVRAQIAAAIKSAEGQEVCTTYTQAGDHLSATVTMNGQPKPEFSQTVIWVKPSDGYTVSP